MIKCKPIVTAVSAVLYTGDNAAEVAAFAGISNHEENGLYRHFSAGARHVNRGDYVVKVGADLHVMPESEFKLRFEVEGAEKAPAKKDSKPAPENTEAEKAAE
ncbi:hypothetical protein [Burkholderia phage BCSR129]|nr:hypothetical protein [Burkholderia phage BCSR129]